MDNRIPGVERINFLKVPVDIIREDQLEEVFHQLSEDGGKHQIVLINFFDLMRARRRKDYLKTLNEASLVLPTAKSIINGTKFLKKPEVYRYRPFDFVIRVLGIMERYNKTLYLIGGKQNSLQTVFNNMRISFPGLNIVGRYTGYYSQNVEENILTAIKKSSPSLLLGGRGLKGGDRWINCRKDNFNPGIYLSCIDCFDIFRKKKKKGSRKSWENGTEIIPEVLKNPFKIFRVFLRMHYVMLLIIYRIAKK